MHLHDSMMMMTREQVSTSVISIIKAAYLLQGTVEWFQNWLGLQRVPQWRIPYSREQEHVSVSTTPKDFQVVYEGEI